MHYLLLYTLQQVHVYVHRKKNVLFLLVVKYHFKFQYTQRKGYLLIKYGLLTKEKSLICNDLCT